MSIKFASNISEFFVDNAKYHITDKFGNKMVILVNYSENSYMLITEKKAGELGAIRKEAKKIAENLLERKSRVNIVNR